MITLQPYQTKNSLISRNQNIQYENPLNPDDIEEHIVLYKHYYVSKHCTKNVVSITKRKYLIHIGCNLLSEQNISLINHQTTLQVQLRSQNKEILFLCVIDEVEVWSKTIPGPIVAKFYPFLWQYLCLWLIFDYLTLEKTWNVNLSWL